MNIRSILYFVIFLLGSATYVQAQTDSLIPGLSAPYPLSPTMKNEYFITAGYPDWKHYTWIIHPEKLKFYVRETYQDESENEMVFFMQIPMTTNTESIIIINKQEIK